MALSSAPAASFSLMPDAIAAGIVLTTFLTIGYTLNVMAMSLATIVVPPELRGLFVAVTVTGGAVSCTPADELLRRRKLTIANVFVSLANRPLTAF